MPEVQQRTWAKIVAQAWADADYKARLLADPAAVLKEAGLDVPAGITLQVVENTANVAHFVLPAPPIGAHGTELEERVSATCGGIWDAPNCGGGWAFCLCGV